MYFGKSDLIAGVEGVKAATESLTHRGAIYMLCSYIHIYIHIRTWVKVISSPALRELRPPKNALNSAIGASTVW